MLAISLLLEEKRHLEARIQQLEEDNEEQGNSEVLLEKAKKAQTQIEQLIEERAGLQKLENFRILLERQNKEWKLKLQEVEMSQKAKSKSVDSSLENKLVQMEEQLEEEIRDKQLIAKSSLKLDKRVKELLLQLDDERSHADQYKEQLEKANNRIKNFKRQLDESEEECLREEAAKRKVQRELEDLHESNENLQRELTNLKYKMRRGGNASPIYSRLASLESATRSKRGSISLIIGDEVNSVRDGSPSEDSQA